MMSLLSIHLKSDTSTPRGSTLAEFTKEAGCGLFVLKGLIEIAFQAVFRQVQGTQIRHLPIAVLENLSQRRDAYGSLNTSSSQETDR